MARTATVVLAAVLLAAQLLLPLVAAAPQTVPGSKTPAMAELEPSESPTCYHNFAELAPGEANITATNPLGGDTVVAVSAVNLSAPRGYILFTSTPNYSVWLTQDIGPQRYSFNSGGGVAGYLSCGFGVSLKLLKYSEGQTSYLLPTQNYTELLVVAVCFNSQAACGEAYAGGAKLTFTGVGGAHPITFLYGAVNSSGAYLPVNVAASDNYLFLIGVSHTEYGWVRGTVSPASALVLVNGTQYLSPGGEIDIELHYGIYNLSFLAKGYLNMSVVVAVYGGQVTPLSISLSSRTTFYEKLLSKALGYYLLALFGALAVVMGIYSVRRSKAPP